jgi:hypothetical protein
LQCEQHHPVPNLWCTCNININDKFVYCMFSPDDDQVATSHGFHTGKYN